MYHKLKSFFILILLSLPLTAQAEIHTFKHFTLDIPQDFIFAEKEETIEITNNDKTSVLIISKLPYAEKNIDSYAENLAKQWNAQAPTKIDKSTYYFDFQDNLYGLCAAYAKQIGNKQYFFLMAGEDKSDLEAIFMSLEKLP